MMVPVHLVVAHDPEQTFRRWRRYAAVDGVALLSDGACVVREQPQRSLEFVNASIGEAWDAYETEPVTAVDRFTDTDGTEVVWFATDDGLCIEVDARYVDALPGCEWCTTGMSARQHCALDESAEPDEVALAASRNGQRVAVVAPRTKRWRG